MPIFCDRCRGTVAEICDPLDELTQINALLERLTLKRYDLKRKINRFHSPIVRQLPPDVTSTIFEFCLPDFLDFQPSQASKVDLCVPLALGAICSYWREIAWSTPSLWSSLVVHVNPSKRDSHMAIAQEWLARSGQLPLSIRIFSNSHEPIPQSRRQAVSALADIINQYSTRWSDFDLCMPQRFYQFFDATAPILKSIRFYCSSKYDAENLNFQLICPRLERANLSRFRMDGTNIQWDNLTHLYLHRIPFADSFLILRKTPRLVFCKISFVLFEHSEPIIGTPVLTSLVSLQLMTVGFEIFLSNLIAPHLEELSLFSLSIPYQVVAPFFEKSACSLRSFSISFTDFHPYFESFMSLLQLIPSLKRLSITADLYRGGTLGDLQNILQLVAKILYSQSTTLQQGLLSNLEVLEYTGELRLRPANYADLYPLPPAHNGPLHLLKLDLSPATRIPKSINSYFFSLAERGVTVNVLSRSEDILQSSINYYRNREEFLCRDWIDNLDLSLMRKLS